MEAKERNSASSSSCDHGMQQFGVCHICKDHISSDIVTTRCGHIYHGKCVHKWLENSLMCPVCRTTAHTDELIKIFPGIIEDHKIVDGTGSETVLTLEEVQSLAVGAFRAQKVVYNQLSVLGTKLSEQATYIETLKAKLSEKEQKVNLCEAQRQKLDKDLGSVSKKHDVLMLETIKMTSENEELQNQLQTIDATVEYMDTLVEQHQADSKEAADKVVLLTEQVSQQEEAFSMMQETISRIEVIRYEIETEENAERPVEDFVEDLVAENSQLRADLDGATKSAEVNEFQVLDLELVVGGLSESLSELKEANAIQNTESAELEAALVTLKHLYEQKVEEVAVLTQERDQYQNDIRDMLGRLKENEENRDQNLSEKEEELEKLLAEKEDTHRMLGLKDDVIRTLQDSIKTTATSFLDRLEHFAGTDGASVDSVFSGGERTAGAEADLLAQLDNRFKILSRVLEKKDDLLIHMMNERRVLEEAQSVQDQIQSQETLDKIELMQDKIRRLDKDIHEKETSLEEKEMIISHLVNVVNRYAFNDRDDNDTVRRRKKMSEPVSMFESVSLSIANSTSEGPDSSAPNSSNPKKQRASTPARVNLRKSMFSSMPKFNQK